MNDYCTSPILIHKLVVETYGHSFGVVWDYHLIILEREPIREHRYRQKEGRTDTFFNRVVLKLKYKNQLKQEQIFL